MASKHFSLLTRAGSHLDIPVPALKIIFSSQKSFEKTPASDHVFPVVSLYNLASAAGCRLSCIAVYKAALFVTLSQHK